MAFETQLARIMKIEPERLGSNVTDEHCKLVNRFLASVARLLNEQNSEIQSPHFDPREVFGADESLDKELKGKLRIRFDNSFFVYQIVCRHLRLTRLSESNENAAAHFDLYQPLIEILEDGGTLDLDRGDIVVDGKWTAPVRNFRERSFTKTAD